MMQIGTVLLFFGGFMAIVLGINLGIRWMNRKFPSDSTVAETLVAMQQRLSELEERVDFAERALTQHRAREQLPRS